MALEDIRIVLVSPAHPGNIGAVARAMKTMSLTRLVLVRPREFPASEADRRAMGAIDLLEKHRPFADEMEREAARTIVRRLGGFAMAVELVAAWLMAHESATYSGLADGLGLEDLDEFSQDEDAELRRHVQPAHENKRRGARKSRRQIMVSSSYLENLLFKKTYCLKF